MELRILKSDFLKGLYPAQGIADRKSTLPILANVLLRSDGKERVLVAATDLTIGISAELPARVEKEGGLTLGAKHLFDLVKALPGEELLLRRGENNWAEIKCGRAEYKLVGMADRDFPKLPNHKEVPFARFDSAALRDMIAKTIFSASTDETRYHLNGVLFESDGKRARMVSTDGHRLSKAERDFPSGPKLAAGVIIPRKGLQEISRVLEGVDGPCELGFHQGFVFTRVGPIALSAKLIDAQFPPYDQVIPKESGRKVVVSRTALLDSLRRISILANDRTFGIKLALTSGVLRITSDNPDLGEAKEELEADFQGGKDLLVGFNAKYLIEVVQQIDDEEVQIELGGDLDPGVLRPANPKNDYLGVIMPMRI
jgi:DNA polymerase-3 subunit beta